MNTAALADVINEFARQLTGGDNFRTDADEVEGFLLPLLRSRDYIPRLPGESPCSFIAADDGWTLCEVHRWSGPAEQRSRVLVCPDIHDGYTLRLTR